MTEAEWLASDDPYALLRWLMTETHPAGRVAVPSERRLRLLHEAWESPLCGDERYTLGAASDGSPAFDCLATLANVTRRNLPAAAALLRDVAGNPFRPVFREKLGYPKALGVQVLREAYITPTVLSLAQAAYDERPGRKCDKCRGTGRITKESLVDRLGKCQFCGADLGMRKDFAEPVPWCPQCMSSPMEFRHEDCDQCCGAGRVEDGTLDPQRLAILADALEEGGCPSWERYQDEAGGPLPDFIRPHPLLAHLRSAGPHVRGCWALDLILGKD